MNVWQNYGFRVDPYETTPIGADEEGDQLLVGREREVRQLRMLVSSSNMHPTIEGPNGVGKTSVVAVACYRMQRDFANSSSQAPMLALGRALQLASDVTTAEFVRKVYLAVAQAMIEHHGLLSKLDRPIPRIDEIKKWLNSPILTGGGTNISIAGFGVGSSSNGIRQHEFRFHRIWFSSYCPRVARATVSISGHRRLYWCSQQLGDFGNIAQSPRIT